MSHVNKRNIGTQTIPRSSELVDFSALQKTLSDEIKVARERVFTSLEEFTGSSAVKDSFMVASTAVCYRKVNDVFEELNVNLSQILGRILESEKERLAVTTPSLSRMSDEYGRPLFIDKEKSCGINVGGSLDNYAGSNGESGINATPYNRWRGDETLRSGSGVKEEKYYSERAKDYDRKLEKILSKKSEKQDFDKYLSFGDARCF